MTEESANWCRFAQLMIGKGAKVLRTFIQVEIITSIFRDYSTAWRKRMNATNVEYTKILWVQLDCKLGNSVVKPLEKLRGFWSTPQNETTTIYEQIDELKEWKKNIEQEQTTPVSEGVKKRMDEWSIQIEQEIQKLNTRHTFICKWSDIFLIHLYKSQRDLFLQIEENHKFLNEPLMSKYQLSLESLPNGVEVLKSDLQDWRNNCYKVLLAFRAECDNLIKLGQEEATGDKILTDCLKQFKNDVEDMKINLQIETLCDSWCTELEEVFRKCEDGDYEEAIKKLETIPSFREIKIKKFFSQLIPHNKRRKRKRMEQLFSKFENVSGANDLENFDLTLLVAALKESNVVHSHSPYWDEDVPDWDTSTGADILRLKSYRNDIVAHIKEATLSSSEFEMLWGKVKSILCNIALRCGDKFRNEISLEIDRMKTNPLEPRKVEHLQQKYKEWCKQDIKLELPSQQLQHWDLIVTAEKVQRKVCPICKRQYSTEEELESPMLTNLVYPCSICKIDCSTEDERERHRLSKHVYKCSSCNMQFSTEKEREEHMSTHKDNSAVRVLAGAGSGAAVGLVLGPPGAVVGAAIGGILGLFSGRK